MLSTTKLNQHKLLHLHAASTALFPSSPAVAAHIASKIASVAAASDINLADATWRKTCACCGYTLVPGWTASVRARGSLGDALPIVRKSKNLPADPTSSITPQEPHTISQEHPVRRSRRRGKRTRGTRSHDKTEPCDAHAVINSADTNTNTPPTAIHPADVTSRRTRRPARRRSEKTAKLPRIIYTCKICARRTIHPLPMPPVDTVLLNTESPADETTITSTATGKPAVTTETTVSSNAAAKKRAKSRKNTLADMLAKEQANRSAASSSAGFGLNFMDFMRTG
ncbi:hypothetical protein TWF696_005772 [Orbilia brochopaga]|uniref:Uncharacterized protein n=1 Tax=Orbilia brochopaga TaxID=3140254 RepID=A0AAV9UXJ5_9PEZI